MLLFTLKRLASAIVLIVVISFIAFALLHISGGDIARNIVGPTASQKVVNLKAAQLGLTRPLLVQYWDWLTNAAQGDLGRSWTSGALVTDALSARLPVTLSLVIGTTIVVSVVSVILGVLAARRGGPIDASVQVLAVVGFAIPGFLLALVLALVFAVNLGWFRATGYIPYTTSISGWLQSVTLPIIALAIGGIAAMTPQVRGSVIDTLSRDYVRTLRACGLGSNRVLYKHVMRNAAAPAVAILSLMFVGLLGGTVLVEQIFALPGMGQLTVTATTNADIPVVMGLVVVFAIIVIVVNLLVELAQAARNPKVRLS